MRASGILLPVSSLPSKYGIGCFSKSAFEWIDFLQESGQTFWQILPLGPTSYGDSPYQSFSTFAGNPYFISLEELIAEGLLTREECETANLGTNPSYVDYEKQYENRNPLLHKAYENSKKREDADFLKFEEEQKAWLSDYALFMALKDVHDKQAWNTWEKELIRKEPEVLAKYREELADEICYYEYLQYWFLKQWLKVKKYANDRGIRIIGDIPIYVAFDSADAWMNPELFAFDEDMNPIEVAGCPPDGFTADGQLWGNPIYDWEYHKKQNYAWWIRRIRHCEVLYDVVRIDHFRGFDEYYTIPYGMTNARIGEWKKGPGIALFHEVKKHVKNIEIIAEDLGYMTQSVRDLVAETGYPGMKVLQFAFGSGSDNEYLPHNYTPNSVVYTGTHDNETLMQYLECTEEHVRNHIREYMNRPHASNGELCENLIWMAMSSVGKYCMIPLQDYLGLGKEARMNFPSTLGHNWEWRVRKEQLTHDLASYIAHMTGLSYRWRIDPPKEEETNETDTENE